MEGRAFSLLQLFFFHTNHTSHILEQYFCTNGGESVQSDSQVHISFKNVCKSYTWCFFWYLYYIEHHFNGISVKSLNQALKSSPGSGSRQSTEGAVLNNATYCILDGGSICRCGFMLFLHQRASKTISLLVIHQINGLIKCLKTPDAWSCWLYFTTFLPCLQWSRW